LTINTVKLLNLKIKYANYTISLPIIFLKIESVGD